jgi:glycosyltransferase involved in cell wall biosynthesis
MPSVIRHGSYIGVYPPGRSRSEVRGDLRIPSDAFVFLSLGHIRRYKGLDLLMSAFAATAEALPDAVLVVAGLPIDRTVADEVRAAAETDRRIRALPEFVPDDQVAELFEAADASVLTRADGGTSGALVLALSHGVPIVAPAAPAYEDLVGDDAGWLFEEGDADALSKALVRAADESREQHEFRAHAALAHGEELSWDDSCLEFAALLRALR